MNVLYLIFSGVILSTAKYKLRILMIGIVHVMSCHGQAGEIPNLLNEPKYILNWNSHVNNLGSNMKLFLVKLQMKACRQILRKQMLRLELCLLPIQFHILQVFF